MEIREILDQMIQTGYEIQTEERDIETEIYRLALNAAEIPEDLFRQEVVTKKNVWLNKLRILSYRYLEQSPLIEELYLAIKRADLSNVLGLVEAISIDDAIFNDNIQNQNGSSDLLENNKTERHAIVNNAEEVFIVHGRDDGALAKVENLIRKLQLVPIILNQQANEGLTILEKFEKHSNVEFAIVLYTPCDEAKLIDATEYEYRARQNVVLEHGFYLGKLGRDKVCVLVNGKVVKPSDIDGLLYIDMTSSDWEHKIIKEMKKVGFDVTSDDV